MVVVFAQSQRAIHRTIVRRLLRPCSQPHSYAHACLNLTGGAVGYAGKGTLLGQNQRDNSEVHLRVKWNFCGEGAATGDAAEMDCIAPVSFAHTRKPLQAACSMDRQAAEMDCIALVSFTHTHAAGGITDELVRSWPPNHAKWDTSCQGRPPNALGDLGDLDGELAFGLRVSLLNAQSTSQAAGQANWPPLVPANPLVPLGAVAPSGCDWNAPPQVVSEHWLATCARLRLATWRTFSHGLRPEKIAIRARMSAPKRSADLYTRAGARCLSE
jgi:hypothetical protein